MGRPNVNWSIGVATEKHSTHTSKAIKAGIPFASQVTEPDMKYIIKYDFDLNGATVEMPENCILEFDGGSIGNGTLILNDTLLDGNIVLDCLLDGTVRNQTLYVDILKHADSNHVQCLFNIGASRIVFSDREYSLSNIVVKKDNVIIEGTNTVIIPVKKDYPDDVRLNYLENVFYAEDTESLEIKGFSFESDIKDTDFDGGGAEHIHLLYPSLYSSPLIDCRNLNRVVVSDCSFKNIEGNTYWAPDGHAGRDYGYKQGMLISLWDVNSTVIECVETNNCRFDEQIWCIPHLYKTRKDINIVFRNNHIHDMNPLLDSSALSCVCNNVICESNLVDNWDYFGSIFNLFGLNVYVKDNTIANSSGSSVFDTCEYGRFHNESVIVKDNTVTCTNGILVVPQSVVTDISDNVFRGVCICYFRTRPYYFDTDPTYPWFYKWDESIKIGEKISIRDNYVDGTCYNSGKNITDYYNVYISTLAHPNRFLHISGNTFKTLESYGGQVTGNYPTIVVYNTEYIDIVGNTFMNTVNAIDSDVVYTNIVIRHINPLNETYAMLDTLRVYKINIESNTFDFPLSASNCYNSVCQILSNNKNYLIQRVSIINNTYRNNALYYGYYAPHITGAYIREMISDYPLRIIHYLYGIYNYMNKPTVNDSYNASKNRNGMFAILEKDGIGVDYSDYASFPEETVPSSIYNDGAAAVSDLPYSVSPGRQINIPGQGIFKVIRGGDMYNGHLGDPDSNGFYKWVNDNETSTNVVLFALFSSKKINGQHKMYIGDLESRPALSSYEKGATMYDTTLEKLISWNGSAWKDAAGESENYFVVKTVTIAYNRYSSSIGSHVYTIDGLGSSMVESLGLDFDDYYYFEIPDKNILGKIDYVYICQSNGNTFVGQDKYTGGVFLLQMKSSNVDKIYLEVTSEYQDLGEFNINIRKK